MATREIEMSQRTVLTVPTAETEAVRFDRFFAEEGVTRASVLEAVDLTCRRTDVFLRDALETFAEEGTFRSACSAGCGYCCHTLVSAIPPEVFYVARHVETAFDPKVREALKARVRSSDATWRGRSGAARYAARAACPFLHPETWLCELHEARPTVCRAMHSGKLAACKAAYAKRDPHEPAPTMKAFFDSRDAHYAAWAHALGRRGLAMKPVELNQALVTVWDGRDVFGRWLGGEDVFAEARVSQAA